jgi:DNA-binding LacI/PurR family transcriptional regulator
VSGPERPTIEDIARYAGVSKGAVSFALNGRPGVSEQTRQRILRIAEELNWYPHSAARALGGARADVVGLVLARPARTLGVEAFFAQVVSGLQVGLSVRSVALQLLIVPDTDAEIAVYRRWSSEHRVDGVVLVDARPRDPRLPELARLGLPAVLIGGPVRNTPVATVWVDDRAAMLSIVEYLAALGHRRIAHVAGAAEFQHTQRRMRALRDAAGRLGLTGSASHNTDFSDTQGAAITRRLLSSQVRPTAIVYDNDVMAVAGLGVAAEMGVAVPGELAVVAFDDSQLAQLVHPSLTALSRDTSALGSTAAELLLELLDGGPAARRDVQAPTPVLTVRESTAPPAVAKSV